jgi:hypothetical protein
MVGPGTIIVVPTERATNVVIIPIVIPVPYVATTFAIQEIVVRTLIVVKARRV